MNVEALCILHRAPGVDFCDFERLIRREVLTHLDIQASVTRTVTTYPSGLVVTQYRPHANGSPEKTTSQEGVRLPGWALI